jgi:translocation and assembly module TamB
MLAGAGAAWRGWIFARYHLTPLLSEHLTEVLERPVELGDVTHIGFTRVRVGPSQIPPTATDPDRVALEALEIRFNPFELWRRELGLEIALEQATIYLEQDETGEWITIDPDLFDPDETRDPFIDVKVRRIVVNDSDLTLVPYAISDAYPPEVAIADVQGQINIDQVQIETPTAAGQALPGQQVNIALRGAPVLGGSINFGGAILLPGDAEATVESAYPSGPLAGVQQSLTLGPTIAWAQGQDPDQDPDQDDRLPTPTQLTLRTQNAQSTDIMAVVESFLDNPLPLQFPSGLVSGVVNMRFGDGPFTMTGTAQVNQATVTFPALPDPIENLEGTIRFRGRELAFEEVTATRGELSAQGEGTLNWDTGYNLQGRLDPFTLEQLTRTFDLTLPVATTGAFTADVNLTGPLNRPQLATNVRSQGQVILDQIPFTDVGGSMRLQGSNLVFDEFRAIPQAGGSLTGTGQLGLRGDRQVALALTGDRLPADTLGQPYGLPDNLSLGLVFVDATIAGPLNQLVATASWRAPMGTYPARGDIRWADNAWQFTDTFIQVAGGTVGADGTLVNRQWQAALRGQGLQLAQLGIGTSGTIDGTAQLSGTLDDLSLAGIQGTGTAAAVIAGGNVITQASLAQGQWTADVEGDGLALQAFSPNWQGTAAGNFQFSGTTGNLTAAGIQGQGQLRLSDGLATVATTVPQLLAVQAPLVADLAWDGQVVQVQQATTAGIRADGTVTPRLSGPGAPALANLDLRLLADNVNLAAIPAPFGLPVQGQGSFAGQLTGSLETLSLSGFATLAGLAVSDLAFASPLTGAVDYSQVDGLNLDLQGGGDRIWVATQQGDRDLEFWVRGGDALAQGYTQGADYYARLENLPLDGFNLPPGSVDGLGTVSGTVTEATVVGNWQTPTLRATFDIENPGFGYLRLQTAEAQVPPPPDQPDVLETRYGNLRGTVIYANDIVSLVGVSLESASGSGRYLASGTYALGTQQLNGELIVDNGQINDLLLTFKIFELADLRPNLLQPPEWFRRPTAEEFATLTTTTPVGDRQAPLIDQLRRLAEVLELQDILAAQADTEPLPPLEELRGRFSGSVTASGIVPGDLAVDVDLVGANWVWGDPTQPNGALYRIEDIVARGTYADDVIQLSPLSLRSRFLNNGAGPNGTATEDIAFAELNGSISLDPDTESPGTLRLNVANVPVSGVRRPLRLPDNLDGLLNAGASITGPFSNLQVRGRLTVDEATINRNPVEQIASAFNYQDARLNLIGTMTLADQTRPLQLNASLPYQLPGVQRLPDSDQLDIRLRVEDEGFSLVNLLTQAVAWESGQGELNLEVVGAWPINQPFQDALASLQVSGAAAFNDVTLSAQALPEPITNVRGRVQVAAPNAQDQSVYVNGLVLDVQNLRGDFSNGEVIAQGNLKVLPSIEDLFPGLLSDGTLDPLAIESLEADTVDNPLRIILDNLALDLRNPAGNYRGRADADITIGGSLFLLEPLLRGEVQLSNGVLTLPEAVNGSPAPGAPVTASAAPTIYEPLPPVFEDFQLTLADNVRLAIPGLVDVRAEGSLDLVGSGANVRPDGRINLPSGRINLLTTEFRLSGDENYAEFDALDETIDPYLVANLSAVLADSSGGTSPLAVATPFPRNEISDAEINQLGLTQSGVQTIRIRASVDGRVSRVVNQLQGVELTSTPPRSEGQIVALISGGLLTALESTLGSVSGGGDSFQGLIAFAGSALLNNLQSLLDSSLENVELRLFAASPPSSQGASGLDVGGELGFNLSPNLSLSVQKVFTNITPAVFNVRYRITDRITVRGTTSYEQFNENTGAILEFQF